MLLSKFNHLQARPAVHAELTESADAPVSQIYVPAGRRLITLGCGGAGRFHWEPHRHHEHELFWGVRGGPMLVVAAGRLWVIPPGGALWVPAGVPHEVHLSEATRFEATFVDTRWKTEWVQVQPVAVPRVAAELFDFLSFGTMATEMRDRAEQLVLDVVGLQGESLIDLPMPRDPRLVRVVQIALADLSIERSLDEWCALAAMSQRNFTRRFRAETRMSFTEWRTVARMRVASAMVAAGEPLGVVAARVGYQTPSAFISAFRRVTGRTPGSLVRLAQ